jgi:hypothetical protein
MNSTDPQIRADILDPARFAHVLRHSIWSKQAEILRARFAVHQPVVSLPA